MASPNCCEQRKPAQLKVARVLELIGGYSNTPYGWALVERGLGDRRRAGV
jgi:hypothetical protein